MLSHSDLELAATPSLFQLTKPRKVGFWGLPVFSGLRFEGSLEEVSTLSEGGDLFLMGLTGWSVDLEESGWWDTLDPRKQCHFFSLGQG